MGLPSNDSPVGPHGAIGPIRPKGDTGPVRLTGPIGLVGPPGQSKLFSLYPTFVQTNPQAITTYLMYEKEY